MFSKFSFVNKLMIGIRENAFELKTKETRNKFNPGLTADRPSNNWAQQYTVTT